jgi:hypothetical protein
MLAPIADAFRDLGISVFPVIGKQPLCKSWQAPPDLISPKSTGLGIVLGSASGGLICRDFDQAVAFREWADENPDLAAVLPIARTRRGYHVYCRTEEPIRTQKFDDGELRGDGSYVIAPPSLHPEGGAYRWVQPMARVVPMIEPRELLLPGQTLRAEKTHKQSPLTHNHSSLPWGFSGSLDPTLLVLAQTDKRGFIDKAIALTQPDGYGQRNACLFRLAMILRHGIPETSEADLEAIVMEWHRVAHPRIKTKDFAVSWGDFQRGWKYSHPDRGFMTYVVDEYARSGFWVDTGNEKLDAVHRVFTIAESYRGEGSTFFLGSRDVATITGVSQSTANRRINELHEAGLIIIVGEPGIWDLESKRGKASCWSLPRLETIG